MCGRVTFGRQGSVLPTSARPGQRPPVQRGRPARSARVCTASKPASASRRAHCARPGRGHVRAAASRRRAGVPGRRATMRAQRRQAVAAGRQRQLRFVAQRRQVRVVLGDVGRVADHQVEAPAAAAAATSRLRCHSTVQAEARGVGACHGQRRRRCSPLRRRAAAGRRCFSASAIAPLPVPRSSDRRARWRQRRGQQLERPVDQRLGVGPRHQHRAG